MILKKEIENIASQKGVAKATIDKDWVLGHFIDGIFSIPEYRKQLVFKGGTCLRKCYFRDYRFSEDLDFTIIGKDFTLSKSVLQKIIDLIHDRTEIPLHIQEIKPLKSREKQTGFSAIIKYWGADHPRNQPPPSPQRWQTSIKLEMILYEEMVFASEDRAVHHEYSDFLSEAALKVPCYSLHEVLAEKLRSLIQRSYPAPRDVYDIWFLSENVSNLNWPEIIKAFHQKMAFKGVTFTGTDQFINDNNDKRLQNAWHNSLAHQVPSHLLPEYAVVRNDLLGLFEHIFNG